MKFTILCVVFVNLAVYVADRHPPFVSSRSISRPDHGVKFRPGTSAGPSPPVSPLEDEITDSEDDLDACNPDVDESCLPRITIAEFASDALWNKHIRKGNSLHCSMCGTDVGAGYQVGDTRTPPSAASRWTGGVVEILDWFWFDSKYGPEMCYLAEFWGMGSMFRGLGISAIPKTAAGGDVQCFQLRHRNDKAKNEDGSPMDKKFQSYRVGGNTYFATDAAHFFALNLRAGVIIGIDLKNPVTAAKRFWDFEVTQEKLLKLRNLSDLYWGYWLWYSYLAGTRVDNINKYIVFGVQNKETVQIVARALRNRGQETLEDWPGQYFTVESTEGLALLGSPIGATLGYFLSQHKKELGNKYVSGISIVRNDMHDEPDPPDLVFYISDVPPEKSIPDVPDHDPPQGQPKLTPEPAAPALEKFSLKDVAECPVEEHVLGCKDVH